MVHLLVYHEVIVCGLLVPAEATEVISYGMPAFKYKGRLIGYAAFQNPLEPVPPGGLQASDILRPNSLPAELQKAPSGAHSTSLSPHPC
ncbi:MAG: hypothetical protein EBY17_18090 [Acidobacteriia bacterium]|nr:hypothetical protein [Terriglobia bacterium]